MAIALIYTKKPEIYNGIENLFWISKPYHPANTELVRK